MFYFWEFYPEITPKIPNNSYQRTKFSALLQNCHSVIHHQRRLWIFSNSMKKKFLQTDKVWLFLAVVCTDSRHYFHRFSVFKTQIFTGTQMNSELSIFKSFSKQSTGNFFLRYIHQIVLHISGNQKQDSLSMPIPKPLL